MRFSALVTDYDGTLATKGKVRPATWSALGRLRADGVKIVLATGRTLPDLRRVCPEFERFDAVVAENGALLRLPGREVALARPPPDALLERLRERGVSPLDRGRVLVATTAQHARTAREAMRELGLRWRVVMNRGSAMMLPAGVGKHTGLAAALAQFGHLTKDAVAIGDAENDAAMLAACGLGVAVANAVLELREQAQLVMRGAEGAGVEELVRLLLVK